MSEDHQGSLSGLRVVVTRPLDQAEEFSAALEAAGARVILLPAIEIAPTADPTGLDRALKKLVCYDWLVLTSVNGVAAVWERFASLGIPGVPPGVKVATIGPKTSAALLERGIEPDFVPDEYVAEAILPGLGDLRGRWVLLPRADLARPDLAHAISASDGVAHEIAAYRTVPAAPDPEGLRALEAGVDVITFTSSSTVRNFVAMIQNAGFDLNHLPGNPIFACIGPITAKTAEDLGLQVAVLAQEYTTEGLLRALVNYFRERV